MTEMVYLPIVFMLAIALAIGVGMFVLTSVLGPRNMTLEKSIPYEAGCDPIGSQQPRLSVKYYALAVLFVVFDVELVFLYPWALVFRDLRWLAMIEMVTFIACVAIALLYAWKKGALEWHR